MRTPSTAGRGRLSARAARRTPRGGRLRPGLRLLLGALALALAHAAAAQEQTDPAAPSIAASVREARHPGLRSPRFDREHAALVAIYAERGHAPLWLAGPRPTPQAAAALLALTRAGSSGLDPADYDAEPLRRQWRSLRSGAVAADAERARFDVGLTLAFVRLLSDLHSGRLEPRNVAFGLDTEARPFDPAALVTAAVRDARVGEAVAEAKPPYGVYQRLEQALAEYRRLASDASLRAPAIAVTLRPGDAHPSLPELARYLAALRDLPPHAGPPPARYEGELVDAVRRFQRRHGLAPDGVIGETTRRALLVPPARRARQIELALERFRWIPDVRRARFVFVNVPAFELLAFDGAAPSRGPTLSMRIVVGKAGRTPTPLFTAALRTVVFRPYWNVPRSIAVGEMLPKLRRDPGYLADQQLEIVESAGFAVLSATPESVELLAAGRARLRQRPGPRNALGTVKFLLPNRYSVYLHDTPSHVIFERSRRDFSHGCVRLEDAPAFAAWVLRDRPEWSEAAIRAAMAGPGETRVAVREPILVIVSYATAIARRDGTVSFYEDLYGHDARLERALAAVGTPPPGGR